MPKNKRQERLLEILKQRPFMTDTELAAFFDVSVQTIRLDRLEQAIPELRERIKHVAQQNYDQIKSLRADEVIGEIIDLHLDQSGISILDIRAEHVFSRNQIARGHHLFAQANSLAIAIIDDELALTAAAQIKFLRAVKLNERVVAKARLTESPPGRTLVIVESFCGEEAVFRGEFKIYRT